MYKYIYPYIYERIYIEVYRFHSVISMFSSAISAHCSRVSEPRRASSSADRINKSIHIYIY